MGPETEFLNLFQFLWDICLPHLLSVNSTFGLVTNSVHEAVPMEDRLDNWWDFMTAQFP